mgnify:CR=1 FL=1|tara:strand:- start:187 stop:582 length:396 start_codon:yes stop_codon:yes gene_type:complete
MSERSTKWQRDNFSNKQILEHLSLLKVEEEAFGDLGEKGWNEGWNEAIDSLADMFYCLDLPDQEFGAMAFNKETKMFEHIGKEPEDVRQARVDKEKELRARARDSAPPEVELPPLSAIFQGADQYTIPLAD